MRGKLLAALFLLLPGIAQAGTGTFALQPGWQQRLSPEAAVTFVSAEHGAGTVFLWSDGAVSAVDALTGKQLWRTELLSAARASMQIVADPHGVLLLPRDGSIIVLDDAGQELWSREGSTEDWSQLQFLTATEKQLFVHSWRTGLLAFDRLNGTELWPAVPLGSSVSAVLAGETLVVSHDESGAITISVTRGFDLETGNELWRHNRMKPLSVAADETVVQHSDYYFIPGSEVRTSLTDTRTGEELAFGTATVPDSSVSPAAAVEAGTLIIGRQVTRRSQWQFPGGAVETVSECCYLAGLYTAPLYTDGAATRVATDFTESARWLATSWPYALVAAVDAGELWRIDLETAAVELLAELDGKVSLTAADDAGNVALLTESGVLAWVGLDSGSVAGMPVADGVAAGSVTDLQVAADFLLLRTADGLHVYLRD